MPVLATATVTRPVPVFVIVPAAIEPLPESVNSTPEFANVISAGLTTSSIATVALDAVSSNTTRSPTMKFVAAADVESTQLSVPPTSTAEPVFHADDAFPRHLS